MPLLPEHHLIVAPNYNPGLYVIWPKITAASRDQGLSGILEISCCWYIWYICWYIELKPELELAFGSRAEHRSSAGIPAPRFITATHIWPHCVCTHTHSPLSGCHLGHILDMCIWNIRKRILLHNAHFQKKKNAHCCHLHLRWLDLRRN